MTHEYTLLVGGTIFPGPGSIPATAMAWAAGTVIAIGSEAAIRAISRGDSMVLDLHGSFAIGLSLEGTSTWPPALLEIGAPADIAILDTDPRLAGPRRLKAAAIIRGGHVVEGELPTASDPAEATRLAPAVFSKVMDNDDALSRRLARDLDAAFPDLVAGHANRLYTIALRQLGSPSDAEEVAQDALVRAYRAMAGYESARIAELKLRPWLATIAVNLARNRRRRLSDRHPAVALETLTSAGFEPRDDGIADPAAVSTGRETADELAGLLLRLPAPVRAAIVLRHVDGLSVAETAAALGRPEGTIKAQVSRGLEQLRALLVESIAAAEPASRPPAAIQPRPTESRRLAAAEVPS